MSRWLERYRAGACVQVWTELTSLGADVRAEHSWPDAAEVTRETMQRVRRNVDRLLELLPAKGYEFAENPDVPVFVPPPDDIAAQLDGLEARIGRLPFALRCWFEEVGLVNLTGRHADWSYEYTDPLVVDSPPAYIESEHALWQEDRGTEWDRGSFVVDLAPDVLHKADVSGGHPYAVAVPNDGVDGLFLWERHQTTFVNYLRICFRWGGFPGWDPAGAHDGWYPPPAPPPRLVSDIANSLLPI